MNAYTEMQSAVLAKYVLNIGDNVESEVNDNCNPIDYRDVARILGCTKQVANGVLVSLYQKDIVEDSTDGDGRPLYMFTELGVRECYRLRA